MAPKLLSVAKYYVVRMKDSAACAVVHNPGRHGCPKALDCRQRSTMATLTANQSMEAAAEGGCIAPTTLIAVIAPLVAILLVLSCCIATGLHRHAVARRGHTDKLLKDHDTRLDQRVNAAIRSTHQISHPGAFVSGTDFVQLRSLRPFEKLRDHGKLRFCDTYADLINTREWIVFISHQWVGFQHPDPKQEQYEVMVAAVKRVASELKGVSIRASNPGHSCALAHTQLTTLAQMVGTCVDAGRRTIWTKPSPLC